MEIHDYRPDVHCGTLKCVVASVSWVLVAQITERW